MTRAAYPGFQTLGGQAGSSPRWPGSDVCSRFASDLSYGTSRARTGSQCSRPTRPIHSRAYAACIEPKGFANGQRARPQHVPQVSTMRRSAQTGGVSDEEQPQGARHARLFEAIIRARDRSRSNEVKRPTACPSSHDSCGVVSGRSGAAAAGADGGAIDETERGEAAEHELSSRSTRNSSSLQQQRPGDARLALHVRPPGALRVAAAADGRLGARLVLHAGRSVRLPASAGRPQYRCRGWDGWG